MKNTTDSDSRSPPESRGVITRAQADRQNDTAHPPLTSGFGAVIEKEYDLHRATECSLGRVSGHRAGEIDRVLRDQHSRLGANIALLEQRYEALPKPQRFVTWSDRRHSSKPPRRAADRDETDVLPDLIARHTGLLADIDALIDCGPDGQRGELILTQVGRSHKEMASTLTALLSANAPASPSTHKGEDSAAKSTKRAQENWDNEGGPVSSKPLAR